MEEKDDSNIKSWILLSAGLVGIAYQQWTGEVNWVLLLIFTTMTGVPGITNIISLVKNSPIVLQSSSSQPVPSEQDSQNASRNLSEDNNGK